MHPSIRSKQDERRKGFKKGLDPPDSRLRRIEENVKIRKNKREELALKRRNIVLVTSDQTAEEVYFASQAADNDLNTFIQMILSTNEEEILRGTRSIRRILSRESNPPIDKVVQSNIVLHLVKLLECENIQFEAAWVLTNIAAGTSDHTKSVIQAGAVPAFVKMIQTSQKIENKGQAVWALGNIAGESTQTRDYVLSCGALGPLIENLKVSNNKSFLRNGTWFLSNLVRGKPCPDFDQISGCLEPLYRLLHLEDEEILGDACWAISYISDGEDYRIQAVVEAGFVPRLVKLIKSNNQTIVTPALRAIGNIVTGNFEQTQAALNMGCLTAVCDIMKNSSDSNVLKECCWTISNITAGTAPQIQQVLESGAVPLLLHLMEEGEFNVKKETAWTVSNAISGGSDEQVKYLMNEGFLKALVGLLSSHDCETVIMCLDGLSRVLEIGNTMSNMDNNPYTIALESNGGLDIIEDLQNHSHEKIHEMTGNILDQYFEEEEERDSAFDDKQTGFAFGEPTQSQGDFTF